MSRSYIPLLLIAFAALSAQQDRLEDRILRYPLPNALTLNNGQPVTDVAMFALRRRPEIVAAFSDHVYGRTPSAQVSTTAVVNSIDARALNGTAIRKEVILTFEHNGRAHKVPVLLYLPIHARGPVPVIVGLNFFGNQTVDSAPSISLPLLWEPDRSDTNPIPELRRHIQVQAPATTRGTYAYRWPIAKIIAQGVGLATACYSEIEPDFDGSLPYSVRALFVPPDQTPEAGTKLAGNAWGAIGAWAWGLARIADYLRTDPAISPTRIGVFGFSRLGKAAVWAAAQNPSTFAFLLSNESGVGGASLYRAKAGETIQHLNSAFPHWFCQNFHQYTGHPDRVPVDGNLILALIAPRPLYVASAELDTFSNPEAEFLSALVAGGVYQLYGKRGLAASTMPALNHPLLGNAISYHVRSGKHEVTDFDWDQYLKMVAGIDFNLSSVPH